MYLLHAQVYLAKWQETDVAVKVITQMQNLSPMQGTHPQDPETMRECSFNQYSDPPCVTPALLHLQRPSAEPE